MNPYQRLGSKGISEVKDHPFFKGTDWEGLMKGVEEKNLFAFKCIPGCEGVFIPQGKDIAANHFPKANDRDDDLILILEDQMRCSTIKVDKDFKDFEGTCFQTLQSITNRDAEAAIRKQARKKAKASKA